MEMNQVAAGMYKYAATTTTIIIMVIIMIIHIIIYHALINCLDAHII